MNFILVKKSWNLASEQKIISSKNIAFKRLIKVGIF